MNFLSFPIWCGIVIEQPWPECHFISPLSKQKMSIIYGKKYSFECKLQEVYSSLHCTAKIITKMADQFPSFWWIKRLLIFPWPRMREQSLYLWICISLRRAEFGSSPRFTFDFSPQKLTSEEEEEKKTKSLLKKNFPIVGKFLKISL